MRNLRRVEAAGGVTLDIVADDGCRLWVTRTGSGPPVVFCHGGPGLWDMAADIAEMIGDIATVVRWDQRGGGRSQRRGPYSVARFTRDLDVVRQHFALERMTVLGHSWGAQLGLRYALDHPDRVSALVYLSGTGLGRVWHPHYKQTLRERLDDQCLRFDELSALADPTSDQQRELAVLRWSTDFADRAAGARNAQRMATPWFAINLECSQAINAEVKTWSEEELWAACRNLAVPTLILDGEDDPRLRSAVDSLEQALPDVTRTTIPDAGHLPWMEQPEPFRAALRSFLLVTSDRPHDTHQPAPHEPVDT